MEFEWDERKRRENIRKHGFDFLDVPLMFSAPMLVMPDLRYDYGEDRWIGIGMIKGRIVVVIFAERTTAAGEIVRIISLRKALKHEREAYEQEITY